MHAIYCNSWGAIKRMVSMVVADVLVPIWHQDIYNWHDDIFQSAYNRVFQTEFSGEIMNDHVISKFEFILLCLGSLLWHCHLNQTIHSHTESRTFDVYTHLHVYIWEYANEMNCQYDFEILFWQFSLLMSFLHIEFEMFWQITILRSFWHIQGVATKCTIDIVLPKYFASAPQSEAIP